MAEESGGGVRFPGERFDENSFCQEAPRAEEKISERNSWLCFMGKFQLVFLLMSNKQKLSDPTWSKRQLGGSVPEQLLPDSSWFCEDWSHPNAAAGIRTRA